MEKLLENCFNHYNHVHHAFDQFFCCTTAENNYILTTAPLMYLRKRIVGYVLLIKAEAVVGEYLLKLG